MAIREPKRLGISALPWKLVKGIYLWIERKDGFAIAESITPPKADDSEEIANGHMMKAAPYLYKALYKMTGSCRTCETRDCKDCININSHCMKEALDALEMANGKGNFEDRSKNGVAVASDKRKARGTR